MTSKITGGEYLHEAVSTRGPPAKLNPLADADDRMLGLHDCSLAYAPDPDRYHCLYNLPDNPEHVKQVLDHLADPRFGFVVAPSGEAWRDVLVNSPRPARPVWTGPHYTIYELP